MDLRKWVLRTNNPHLFCLLVNVANLIKSRPIRCRYLRTLKCFEVIDGSQIRYASVNSRVLSYIDGFALRATSVWNSYMLNLIRFQENDLVVDVGANMGDLHYYLKRNLPFVAYVGIEPNPKDFNCLKLNCEDVRLLNIGLWNTNGILPFFVSDEWASSSFIEPPAYSEIIQIPARTLSETFPNTKIRLLKLEAEGAEPEVLEGALQILDNIDYISVDVGPERGVHEEETRENVVKLLTANNFSILRENPNYRKTIIFKRCGSS